MLRNLTGLFMLSFLASNVFSATIVDMQDQNGGKSQFFSEGSMGRLNTADGQSFILVDYKNEDVKYVLPQQKQVIDMTKQLALVDSTSQGPRSGALTLENQGEGPTIAGYETTQYDLRLNDQDCGTVFTSKKALEDSGLEQLFNVMRKLALQQAQALAAVSSQLPPCQLGKLNSMEQVLAAGVPMRTQDETGRIESEVLKVERDASLPPDIFNFPAEYKVIDSLAEMKKAKQQAQAEMKKKLPELEKKLAELQKSGKMRPEELERMKKMIEHYKKQ